MKHTFTCELKENGRGSPSPHCTGVEEAEIGKLIKHVLDLWQRTDPSPKPWAHANKSDLFWVWFSFCSFYSLAKGVSVLLMLDLVWITLLVEGKNIVCKYLSYITDILCNTPCFKVKVEEELDQKSQVVIWAASSSLLSSCVILGHLPTLCLRFFTWKMRIMKEVLTYQNTKL